MTMYQTFVVIAAVAVLTAVWFARTTPRLLRRVHRLHAEKVLAQSQYHELENEYQLLRGNHQSLQDSYKRLQVANKRLRAENKADKERSQQRFKELSPEAQTAVLELDGMLKEFEQDKPKPKRRR